MFSSIKNKKIFFYINKKKIYLIPIGKWIFSQNKLIKEINLNRFKNNHCFLSQVDKNIRKTKIYLENIINNKNICLYVINSKKKIYNGILGIKNNRNNLEIYFVLKFNKNLLMRSVLKKIIKWYSIKFKKSKFIVKVLSNNLKAKKLYYDCGFKDYKYFYLKKIKIKNLFSHLITIKKKSNVDYKYQTLSLSS